MEPGLQVAGRVQLCSGGFPSAPWPAEVASPMSTVHPTDGEGPRPG